MSFVNVFDVIMLYAIKLRIFCDNFVSGNIMLHFFSWL